MTTAIQQPGVKTGGPRQPGPVAGPVCRAAPRAHPAIITFCHSTGHQSMTAVRRVCSNQGIPLPDQARFI
jgi:hypothetical protein